MRHYIDILETYISETEDLMDAYIPDDPDDEDEHDNFDYPYDPPYAHDDDDEDPEHADGGKPGGWW